MLQTTYPASFRSGEARFLTWKPVTAARRERLLCDFAYATGGKYLERDQAVAVREAAPDFFARITLVAFAIPGEWQDRFYFCDAHGLMLDAPFDGSAAPLRDVCAQSELVETPDAMAQYIRFYFHFVRDEVCVWHLAETLPDVPWAPRTRNTVKLRVKTLLAPLTYHGRLADGLFRHTATLVCRGALYRREIILASRTLGRCGIDPSDQSNVSPGMLRGEALMTGGKLLMENLPVIRLKGCY
jgi:hypothetical protein